MTETPPDPPGIDSNRPHAILEPQGASPSHLTPSVASSLSPIRRHDAAADARPAADAARRDGPFAAPSPGLAPSPFPGQDETKGPDIDPKPTFNDPKDTNDHGIASAGKPNGFVAEVRRSVRLAVTYSWLNFLLVFVPVAIAVACVPGVHGGIVFAMNCIAIIPLAGLLSYATESVACNMGDSLGALLNVTFGNAVELIIL